MRNHSKEISPPRAAPSARCALHDGGRSTRFGTRARGEIGYRSGADPPIESVCVAIPGPSFDGDEAAISFARLSPAAMGAVGFSAKRLLQLARDPRKNTRKTRDSGLALRGYFASEPRAA